MAAPRRRDRAFLVERLLPRHLLRPERNAALAAALASGDAASLHEACAAALADLVALGSYTECPAALATVRVFASTLTGDRIHLARPPGTEQQASRPTPATVAQDAPGPQTFVAGAAVETTTADRDEEPATTPGHVIDEPETLRLEELLGPGAGTGSHSTPPATVAPPTAPPQDAMAPSTTGADTLAQLESVLGLAGIENRLTSLSDKLRHLLARLETLFPGAQVRILHLEGAAAEELGDGPVRLLPRNEIETTPHYRAAVQQGSLQLATTAPEGADPATGTLAAVAPLRLGATPWGLLELVWTRTPPIAARRIVPLLGPLARLVELAIQNQQALESLVFIDPLTGVYNRAFYDRQLALEMDRAHRTGRKFALLVMDVDDFKSINDHHGHRAGDQVLARLAHEVRERMRKIDLLFRYGGEEFVLLLPGADLEEARRTAERLRSVVGAHRFAVDGPPMPLHVTVSLGGAIYPDDARTPTGLFRHADGAMYRAKEQGKNRVVFR